MSGEPPPLDENTEFYPPGTPKKPPVDLKSLMSDASQRSGEYRAFLKYTAEKTGVASYEQLALVWPAFCQAAMEWMILRKKSVDLGFCQLHPSPMRANWKQILIAKFPFLGPRLFGKSRKDKERLMELCDFDVQFCDSKMLALVSGRYVAWTMEVEPRKSWWRAMFKQEVKVFNALGSLSYAEFIAKKINDLRARLIRTYLTYLRQVAYPAARVYRGGTGKRAYLAPYVPSGKVRPVDTPDGDVSVVVPRNPLVKGIPPKHPAAAKTDLSKITPVQAMPPMESQPFDLRSDLGIDISLPN